MLWLLCSLAYGGAVVAVEKGETKEVEGPAVVLDELSYKAYVADSRNLPVCRESLDKAIDEGISANERALRARDTALHEFKADEVLIDQQVQTIADLGAKLDDARARNSRLRNQRNVALGVSVGFLSAATAAVVLSLD